MATDIPTQVFREWGKANGFIRKGTTLYRDQEESIAVVNLQGSQWGGRYYLNIAVWLKAVGEESFPKEHRCQLRARLSQLRGPDASERDEAFLVTTNDLPDEERRVRCREALDSVVGPALDRSSTLADLMASPALVRRFLVDWDAYRLLGLPGIGMDDGFGQ